MPPTPQPPKDTLSLICFGWSHCNDLYWYTSTYLMKSWTNSLTTAHPWTTTIRCNTHALTTENDQENATTLNAVQTTKSRHLLFMQGATCYANNCLRNPEHSIPWWIWAFTQRKCPALTQDHKHLCTQPQSSSDPSADSDVLTHTPAALTQAQDGPIFQDPELMSRDIPLTEHLLWIYWNSEHCHCYLTCTPTITCSMLLTYSPLLENLVRKISFQHVLHDISLREIYNLTYNGLIVIACKPRNMLHSLKCFCYFCDPQVKWCLL